jgi:hypothetical protein
VEATQYTYAHASDRKKQAALIFYDLPGDIPRFFAVVAYDGKLQYGLQYSTYNRIMEKILPSEDPGGAIYADPARVIPAFITRPGFETDLASAESQRNCVYWCKKPFEWWKTGTCLLGVTTAGLIAGGSGGTAIGVAIALVGFACNEMFDFMDVSGNIAVGCDDRCKQKETIYCPCPGIEACYHSASECLEHCSNQGLGCVGRAVCAQTPGKCGLPGLS